MDHLPPGTVLKLVQPDAPLLASGLAYWSARRGNRPMPARADLDPIDIPHLLPFVMLINVADAPFDLSYRLVGTEITNRSARDYTGTRIADLPHQRPPSQVWDLFSDAAHQRRPLCALIPRADAGTEGVKILVMPLSADGDRVDMLFGLIDIARRLPTDEAECQF
jgi:hypothetical protein